MKATDGCRATFAEHSDAVLALRRHLNKTNVSLGHLVRHSVLDRRIKGLRKFRTDHHNLRLVMEHVSGAFRTQLAVQDSSAGAGAGAGAGADASPGSPMKAMTTTPARFASGDAQIVREIDRAYAPFLNLPVLDVTPRGEQDWAAALQAYVVAAVCRAVSHVFDHARGFVLCLLGAFPRLIVCVCVCGGCSGMNCASPMLRRSSVPNCVKG